MPDAIRVVMAGRYPREEGKPVGGPEAVAEVLTNALMSTGRVELHFITMKPGAHKIETWRSKSGVNVYVLPEARYGTWTRYFVDRRRILSLVRMISPDIIHVHGTIGAFAHSLVEREWPSVLAIRGIFFRELPFMRGGVAGLKERCRAYYEREALKRVRNLISLNAYTLNSVRDLLCDPEIRYIDNPADDAYFQVSNNEEPGRLLLVAVVRRLKGHEFAVRAVARLVAEGRNVRLRCVGASFEPDYHDQMQQLIKELCMESHVEIAGHASRSELLDEYSRASVVVLPSLVENAPVVISEAMAAGKAVVASPAGGVGEMIEDGKNGLLVPFSDPDALAAAVGRLLDSDDLRANIGAAARDSANSRFRKEVAARKTLDFYECILSKCKHAAESKKLSKATA